MNAVKVPREKDTYYIQRNKDKNKADFSLETMQLKRQLIVMKIEAVMVWGEKF